MNKAALFCYQSKVFEKPCFIPTLKLQQLKFCALYKTVGFHKGVLCHCLVFNTSASSWNIRGTKCCCD